MQSAWIAKVAMATERHQRRAETRMTARRARQCAALHAGLLLAALAVAVSGSGTAGLLAIGLTFPGAGFLPGLGGDDALLATGLALSAAGLFGLTLVLWFATGNVLAPPAAWLGAALLPVVSGRTEATHIPEEWLLLPLAAALLGPVVALVLTRELPAVAAEPCPSAPIPARPRAESCEIDEGSLRLMRLLLDRALQPVEAFDGFEWRDQFQTAAVRYQVNFISYALSIAGANHLPAFEGYLLEAQRRLLAKQSDRRMWRYWAAENAWGHLRLGADPVPRDNIMYTGFVATQIALAEAALGRSLDDDRPHLRLALPGGRQVDYRLDDLAAVLASQYRGSPWGLLACEPHWIYPLCNLITATGLQATDARRGMAHWPGLREGFRRGLEREFLTPDGRIVPFRSSLTGLALPFAGGTVMQAFPCLFLAATFPDLASRQWDRVRNDLAGRDWSRAFWPIDVGNYGFSRASSLTASAAAAVEMGDGETAGAILAYLDKECPAMVEDGVMHRPRGSLWAHALELTARCGTAGGLSRLAAAPAGRPRGPFVADASYPDVLVTRAVARDGALDVVLRPGRATGAWTIGLGGLVPHRSYCLIGADDPTCQAGADGTAEIRVTLAGRLAISATPMA